MNPSDKDCFRTCSSCHRCAQKGDYAKCGTCSGRHDPQGKRDPYDRDDFCRCTEGVLQFRLQTGKLIVRRFPNDPFGGKVQSLKETPDERDWRDYLATQRERYNDEDYNPIQYTD